MQLLLAACFCVLAAGGCAAPQATQALIQVTISADGAELPVTLSAGSTVQQALDQAGVTLNTLDRSEPPSFTVLTDGADVRVVRVTEEFDVEQITLPFERQTLRNESLPVEKEVLIQRGKNGLQEITYRRVFEDGVEVSSEPIAVNSVILSEPLPEIRMIGVQTPFAPVEIPGTLYYVRDGNLWEISESTSSRRAALAVGDLDGRVLSISDDEDWALFTRRSDIDGRINELWAGYIGPPEAAPQETEDGEPLLVDLGVDNVIHFADWAPGSNSRVYFSTVEPRPTAPGWQANNDLLGLNFSPNGWTSQLITVVETNSGGVYGWWGVSYQYTPDQKLLTYSRPDGIGQVDYKTGVITRTLDIVPYQTLRDWAWTPGIAWGPDGKALYATIHGSSSERAGEDSPVFGLAALLSGSTNPLELAPQTGMFAYPLASPLQEMDGGDVDYQIAFLQAQTPETSQTSRYELMVMDRDGSNRRRLFPKEDLPGLDPKIGWGAWSLDRLPASKNLALAVIYEGDLWLVDAQTGESWQVTGDGLTTRVVWK